MVCPRCGKSVSASAGTCPACGAGVAVGVLTPPPTGQADTTLFPDAQTIIPASEPVTKFPADPSTTLSFQDAATGILIRDSPTGVQTQAPPGAATELPTISPGTTPRPPGADPPAAQGGPLAVGESFGPRYHIIRLLGEGGMGAVYQAWDAELGIAVAIKVVRPEITADPTAAADMERRFKRELVLARQVTHKNVVRIHDLGEIHGIKYITMPYVEGADLATVLREQGRLPMGKTLRIIRSVVSGLAAAHAADVVHRDLKPANIMIDANDDALIMDFGIARSTGMAVGGRMPGETTLAGNVKLAMARPEATMAGAVVGTLEYMAPEQARGQHVDQRADIYAIGLILYDMLAGRSRSAVAKPLEELKARMNQAPPPIRSIVPDVPEPLAAVVARCLEPDPAKRYQKTYELEADLDRLDENGHLIPIKRVVGMRLLAAVVTVLLALSGASWWYARRLAPPPPHDPVSVLIADFKNTTQDAAFDGSLEQALSLAMEGASFITAYPRADAVKLARSTRVGDRLDEKVSRLIAVREGVNVVLEGQIAKEGSGYRITVTAFDSSAEPGESKSIATQSAVARDKGQVLTAIGTVANRLRSVLGDTTPESARQRAAETATTASLEALQAYTQAAELKRMNRNDEAMAAYDKAIALDPEFGRAYAGKGDIYMIMKDEAKAKAAFEEALKHVDRMTEREKYRTFGNYYLNIARNNEKAIETFETFVKQYPADDGGHGNLGLAYLYTGNLVGAIAQVREALRIYPRNALQRYNYAMYSLYAGDFDTASAEGSRTLQETPGFTYAYLPVAWSAAARGDFGAAADTYAKLEATGPEGAMQALLGRADLEMARGRYRPALALLQPGMSATEKAGDAFFVTREQVAVAEAYLATGDKRRAAEYALKAAAHGGHESVLVPAARVLVAAGRVDDARQIAITLEKMLQTQTIAYSRLINAEIALQQNRYLDAIEAFNDSIKRRDTWLARYLRGRAYVQTEHYTEALDDLGRCLTRRGEATDAFVYETPTVRYLTPVYYWLGRAQQAVHVADAKKNFEQFLALTSEADPPDPLAADARRRVAAK
jgi:tetratricopeptide (TPR) repeat protein